MIVLFRNRGTKKICPKIFTRLAIRLSIIYKSETRYVGTWQNSWHRSIWMGVHLVCGADLSEAVSRRQEGGRRSRSGVNGGRSYIGWLWIVRAWDRKVILIIVCILMQATYVRLRSAMPCTRLRARAQSVEGAVMMFHEGPAYEATRSICRRI